MENNVPDLPTMPMPAAKPPKKRSKLQPRLLIVLIVGALVLLVGVSMIGIFLRSSVGNNHAKGATGTSIALQNGQATNTATANLSQTTATVTTTTPVNGKNGLTPTSTPIIGAPSVTHGRPHLGGPFTDFVGKYGTPANQGDGSSEDFWVGTDQSIDINVSRNEQGEVTQLDALGPLSWTTQQATSYCTQFLPDNAVQASATATQIDYHTSAGDVELTLQTHSCLLSLAHA